MGQSRKFSYKSCVFWWRVSRFRSDSHDDYAGKCFHNNNIILVAIKKSLLTNSSLTLYFCVCLVSSVVHNLHSNTSEGRRRDRCSITIIVKKNRKRTIRFNSEKATRWPDKQQIRKARHPRGIMQTIISYVYYQSNIDVIFNTVIVSTGAYIMWSYINFKCITALLLKQKWHNIVHLR